MHGRLGREDLQFEVSLSWGVCLSVCLFFLFLYVFVCFHWRVNVARACLCSPYLCGFIYISESFRGRHDSLVFPAELNG